MLHEVTRLLDGQSTILLTFLEKLDGLIESEEKQQAAMHAFLVAVDRVHKTDLSESVKGESVRMMRLFQGLLRDLSIGTTESIAGLRSVIQDETE